ncbi:zinc ribbon domain-containing protein [Lentilactobacillus senioris]|uniref:TcaA second domain-containing protein n=1 Tax=Lentilactobacillus senioris TaxID=931534 RepID=UPI002281CEC5|nr:zinc-ribbon domain-containing protein [Lentilactobacillus senioris]MCY9806163.1 zinc ribbon domain-containing protein [Lentilactobacillus senioris]
MKICPNCHHKNASSNAFCEQCGYDLSKVKSQVASASGEKKRQSSSTNEHHSNSKNPWLIRGVLIVAGVAIVTGGFFYGRKVDKEKQIDTIVNAVQSKQSNRIAAQVVSDNPGLKITGKTVEPFINYLKQNPNYDSDMKASLQQTGYTTDRIFKLKATKNKWLVFPVYKLEVTTMHPEIATNVNNAAIKANGTVLATTKNDNYIYNAGPLFPGAYEFKLEGTQSSATKKVDLMDANDTNKSISLLTKKASEGRDVVNNVADDNVSETPGQDDISHTGSEYEDLSSSAQNVVSEMESRTDKIADNYTYTESEPHDDVYEIELYDKDDDQYVTTYRYDDIHGVLAEYDSSTGKFEEVD